MKTHTRNKCKQIQSPTTNEIFSDKYFRYTKERKCLTPKKSVNFKSQPREHHMPHKSQIYDPIACLSKTPKININMEIKNLNFFGHGHAHSTANLQTQNSQKKILHKKTISNLGQHLKKHKQAIEKTLQKSQPLKKPKHTKTKSQENIKLSPFQWGELLAEHGSKIKKNQEELNLISKFAFCNRKGLSCEKKQKINQDAFILIQNFMVKQRYLFGVCDGHGVNGHFVSDFIKEILPQNIQYYFIKNKAVKKNNKSLIESSLRDAFAKTTKDLKDSGIDTSFSGSTTCLLYLQENQLFCSNLGDSRAVIFSRVDEKWSFKPLSFDHKAEDQRQAYRIKMNGGRVFPYYDENGQPMGPFRVWVQDKNIPGLAMTRSFGDNVASMVGVISEPEICQFQIMKDDKFMVIASDGLWEFISNQEVMDIVIPTFIRNSAVEAVSALEKKAVQAWQAEDQNIDDITIQVIFFKYY